MRNYRAWIYWSHIAVSSIATENVDYLISHGNYLHFYLSTTTNIVDYIREGRLKEAKEVRDLYKEACLSQMEEARKLNK